MKILIISGFLGAGKTTFIQELAKRTGKDFAVMENEYGAIDVDGSLLKQEAQEAGSDLKIWEMTEGCICCSVKADFASSVLTIANAVDPEYLVVEPTGVGMLSRILENLRKIQYDRISLLQPVTVADAKHLPRMLQDYPEICRDQLTAAGTVVLSKCEGLDQETLSGISSMIREIAPGANILQSHYREQPDSFWEELLQTPLSGSGPEKGEEGPAPEQLGLTGVRLAGERELVLFLTGVVSGVFGKIVRAKGYLPAGNSRLRFDVVEGQYTITEHASMEEASRAVFIGDGLRRDWLREALLQDFYAFGDLGRPRKNQGKMKAMPRKAGERLAF